MTTMMTTLAPLRPLSKHGLWGHRLEAGLFILPQSELIPVAAAHKRVIDGISLHCALVHPWQHVTLCGAL